MPSAIRYLVKDSPKPLRDAAAGVGEDGDGKKKLLLQGRHYNSKYETINGGINANEILFGLEMACLSITDDEPDTLKNVGIMNPWQIESLKIITGSKEVAFSPLSTILKEKYGDDMIIDKFINVSGLSDGGHVLDTQGFIAHDDESIILSYRCTTTISDWLTNFTTTTSAWEIEDDLKQGHSGTWSSFEDLGNSDKLRAHTGFYNNFLVTINDIRQYIDPLLLADDTQPPRTLYVVGHSLGAGIAIMAACYFILDENNIYNWANSKHKLRVVTAGGPRACCKSLQRAVDQRIRQLKKDAPGQVIVARVVKDKDTVPTVPPTILGFEHLKEKLVFITKPNTTFGINTVLINPNLSCVVSKSIIQSITTKFPDIFSRFRFGKKRGTGGRDDDDDDEDDDSDDDDETEEVDLKEVCKKQSSAVEESGGADGDDEDDELAAKEKYDKMISMVPRSLRDHMPEFYLKPFINLVLNGTKNMTDYELDDDIDDDNLLEYYGGAGGTEFCHGKDNTNDGGNRRMTEITIYADKDVVHGIKVRYGKDEIHDNGSHGGSSKTLKMDSDDEEEYIVAVKLRLKRIKQKRNIVYLEFDTNLGNKVSHGCYDKGEEVIVTPPKKGKEDNYVLTGFKGRAGKRIDALAFIWGPPPK